MAKVLKKSCLLFLLIILTIIPLICFSGCNNEVKGEKMDNIKTVYFKSTNYTPFNGEVWVDYQGQRISFFVSNYNYEMGESGWEKVGYNLTQYNFALVDCWYVYEDKVIKY